MVEKVLAAGPLTSRPGNARRGTCGSRRRCRRTLAVGHEDLTGRRIQRGQRGARPGACRSGRFKLGLGLDRGGVPGAVVRHQVATGGSGSRCLTCVRTCGTWLVRCSANARYRLEVVAAFLCICACAGWAGWAERD
ncbi:hypothetical protein COCSADRAFT_241347 [Bipolaris sorokiniana ND90Pr]|uniref:Uncharacterized protein n=1 Tax=Cochliobolus sativus (strain ND90Pr / ATCC 201652) TaxID=665912 RepID=M2QZ47_COCSN|nr:uncharacterized protein COCSADRAFT_241347 [Bipolaris sorokiniana ND90Pr]EMD60314.1 hypothetical protein COCSADRAFT_241347 [Bipolaris sorokiniana ND90Pr]